MMNRQPIPAIAKTRDLRAPPYTFVTRPREGGGAGLGQVDVVCGPSQSGRTGFALALTKDCVNRLYVGADIEAFSARLYEHVVLDRGEQRQNYDVLQAIMVSRKAPAIVVDDVDLMLRAKDIPRIAMLAVNWQIRLILVTKTSDLSDRVGGLRLGAHIPGNDYLGVPCPA